MHILFFKKVSIILWESTKHAYLLIWCRRYSTPKWLGCNQTSENEAGSSSVFTNCQLMEGEVQSLVPLWVCKQAQFILEDLKPILPMATIRHINSIHTVAIFVLKRGLDDKGKCHCVMHLCKIGSTDAGIHIFSTKPPMPWYNTKFAMEWIESIVHSFEPRFWMWPPLHR